MATISCFDEDYKPSSKKILATRHTGISTYSFLSDEIWYRHESWILIAKIYHITITLSYSASFFFLFSPLNLISCLSPSDRNYWLNTFFDIKTQLQAHLFNSLISIMCQRNRFAVRRRESSRTEFILYSCHNTYAFWNPSINFLAILS